MECHLLVRSLPGVVLALSPMLAAAQQSDAWVDPSPHSTSFVTVEPGVQLEVLDWGGSGRPILLLAGLGDTAHVFDDFAPMLTASHHVFALTRRGFGESSAPASGYDFARLADDVIGAIDALDLERPIIVGHSFAGEEMHILGSLQPSRIAALVYIDAAFDRADDAADYEARFRELPGAPVPEARDRASIASLRDFRVRNHMAPYPEAEMRTRYIVDPNGAIVGARMPPPAVRESISGAMSEAVREYDPEPLHVRALAIYAVPLRPEDLMRPWYDPNDASVRQTIQEVFVLARARYERHMEWFESFARGDSRATGVSGEHHLFITNPADIREAIDTFAASLD